MPITDTRVSRRLRTRLSLFLVIGIAILCFILYDVFDGALPYWLAVVALAIGGAVGFLLGRVRSVKRHEKTNEIVSELDVAGIAAIVLYIAFDASRDWIFGHWIQGPALSAFTLAILSGALFGRFLGMRMSINRLLRA